MDRQVTSPTWGLSPSKLHVNKPSGPVHRYLFLSEKGDIFPPFSKRSASTRCSFEWFLPVHMKTQWWLKMVWKWYHLWKEHAHLLVPNKVMQSFSKHLQFIQPQEYSKMAFANISTLESTFEMMRCYFSVTVFNRYVWRFPKLLIATYMYCDLLNQVCEPGSWNGYKHTTMISDVVPPPRLL